MRIAYFAVSERNNRFRPICQPPVPRDSSQTSRADAPVIRGGRLKATPRRVHLTDPQWEELAPLLPPDTKQGHPRTTDLREVVNGILYVLRGGIPWRMLPHDLPPWGTVWWYFRNWRDDGAWEWIEEAPRPGSGRCGTGVHPQRSHH